MFCDRLYHAYVVLGSPDAPPVWQLPVWNRVASLFEAVATSPRGPAALRCSQIDVAHNEHISFGRLGWTQASFRKWTHGAHQPLAASQPWQLETLEAWAPSWNVSVREDLPPDFFLALHNEAMGQGFQRTLLFNPTIICALGVSAGADTLAAFRASVLELASLVSSPLTAYLRRPWG